ncbi:kinase-like domain-containing protein [Mycena belliarum]|uniref:Kinase-like domain-containing protein n=1 Tax=Mycena belliarum TaxID=1033014 RepID=A0AAD6UCW7_9AGAR|nr:kinase-like domain-containing protein [Mycena belliae]
MPSVTKFLPDLTGQFILDGQLELLCLLGSGAYGKVYKALDTGSPVDAPAYCAVKCMPRYEPGSRDAKIQENELSLHHMLNGHPRIIAFHGEFCTEDFVFVILELSPGGDFFDVLVSRDGFRGNPARIKQAFGELLDAVEYCHRNSVFHRDLKPENILCNSTGTDIRLADFGLATQIGLSSQFGCGSRSYMSPESLDRFTPEGCYSARHSDLWALSVIFTNMVSGRHPWTSADMNDDGFAYFQSDPEYLVKALKITQPTSALLKWCFDINPRSRPTLQQLRTAVNAIDQFSPRDILSPVVPVSIAVKRVPTPPVDLKWAVAPDAPDSAAGDCETPRPACQPQLSGPRPLQFSPFVLGSASRSSSSCSRANRPPSSPPMSVSSAAFPPSSLPSGPSGSTASDASTPPTPAALAASCDAADVRACSSLVLNPACTPPALPPRAYLTHARALLPMTPLRAPVPSYRTVADKGRPTLPTRRKFLSARRVLGMAEQ